MSSERKEILGDLTIACGSGAPTHEAPAGSLSVDLDTGTIYGRQQLNAATRAWVGPLLQQATVTLDNEQIKALPHPTPVEIVPAPGLGKRLALVLAHFEMNFEVAYGDASSSVMYIGDNDGDQYSLSITGGIWSLAVPGSYSLDAPPLFSIADGAPVIATAQFTTANRPFQLVVANGAVDFTGGHADNTLKVTLYYVEVDL